MAGPMKAARLGSGRILWWTALAGIPMGIGALQVHWQVLSSMVLSLSLGLLQEQCCM